MSPAPTPLKLSLHGTQLEAISIVFIGWSGSLVGIYTLNRCGPSIPACIINTVESMVALSPGLRAIELMAIFGGQQPSRTSR